jgi:hypothetical protein
MLLLLLKKGEQSKNGTA